MIDKKKKDSDSLNITCSQMYAPLRFHTPHLYIFR